MQDCAHGYVTAACTEPPGKGYWRTRWLLKRWSHNGCSTETESHVWSHTSALRVASRRLWFVLSGLSSENRNISTTNYRDCEFAKVIYKDAVENRREREQGRKKWGKEGRKQKGRDRWDEGGRERNRKLLSKLPMALSQRFQTLRNSRQRAGRERRCQEGGRHRTRRAGRAYSLLSKGTATRERKSTPFKRYCNKLILYSLSWITRSNYCDCFFVTLYETLRDSI